jgi:zinc protease
MTAVRPVPGPTRPYQFPAFERVTLANGLTIIVAPTHKLPLVTLLAVVEGGATNDRAGREGEVELVARLLSEGTRDRDPTAFTEQVERLGGSLDSGADWDAATAGITVLASRFEEAMALLAEVLTAPALSPREAERLANERLAEILHQASEPRGLADDMFSHFIYDAAARYARPEGGTAESVRAIAHADIQRAFASSWVPERTTIIVAGDVLTGRAQSAVETVLGSWRAESPAESLLVDTPASAGRSVRVVHKGDAPQSEIRVGHPAVPRSHPDYFPLVVMNAILGGLFNSRINLNLREVHAYTYGAFSSFDWRRQRGPFVVSTAVERDVTAAAVGEILREVDRMRTEPVTVDELSLATSYLDGVFPIRFESTGAIARALASLATFGLPRDYFDSYRERIRAVTVDEVQRVAAEQLQPERMSVVIVGDQDRISESLTALGHGAVTGYDADGRPRP